MEFNKKITSVAVFGLESSALQLAAKIVESKREVFLFALGNEEIESLKEDLNLIGENLYEKVVFTTVLDEIVNADLIIDMLPENGSIKKEILTELNDKISPSTICAVDVFFESVTAYAENNEIPERVIGTHFFNLDDELNLVEIAPGLKTKSDLADTIIEFFDSMHYPYLISTDTPGFVVERLNQIYLGEAIRIFEENLADPTTIDWIIKQNTNLETGPIEKLDLTGIDTNLKISEFLFNQLLFDSNFKPSLLVKRMVEANRLGYKTNYGFYDYHTGFAIAEPHDKNDSSQWIFDRILIATINEAYNIISKNIASYENVNQAFRFLFNANKSLDEIVYGFGKERLLEELYILNDRYNNPRYIPNYFLKNRDLSSKN